ncbi:MAG: sugar phosphate isomerase/epimerase [Phycisphaerae bacterium]|nr:sugar phosphate isomerase/epimerase [Phycisphaerae bacterium]
MKRPRLGVAIDDLNLAPKQGLQAAARMGYEAVEINTTKGELDPARLSQSATRHLRRLCQDLGLDVAALDGYLGPDGFADPAAVDERIDKTRRILELARKIQVPIVTTYLGPVPEDADDRRRRSTIEAAKTLAEFADRTGTFLAITTAQDSPASLRAILKEIDCPMVRVCYDPAGLLIHGHDPMAGIADLGSDVIASHLRDATAGTRSTAGREVRLGTGQLDVRDYLAALEDGQYAGPQIIRRTDAADPVADVVAAKQFLDSLLK